MKKTQTQLANNSNYKIMIVGAYITSVNVEEFINHHLNCFLNEKILVKLVICDGMLAYSMQESEYLKESLP